MNRKFISKSNRILRKILNSKENLDIVQDFIESFLSIKIKEINLNPYLKSKSQTLPSEENFGIANVKIKTEKEEINVGIQFIDGYYIINKMLLYYLQIHSNQIENKNSIKISKTLTINLLDFTYFYCKQYFNKLTIKNKKGMPIELYVIELPKFEANTNKELNKKEAWMVYLNGNNSKKVDEALKKFEKIKKLDNLLEKYWKEERME